VKDGVGWVHNRAAACVAAGGGIIENQIQIKGTFTKIHLKYECKVNFVKLPLI
jgi:hypothetical protein